MINEYKVHLSDFLEIRKAFKEHLEKMLTAEKAIREKYEKLRTEKFEAVQDKEARKVLDVPGAPKIGFVGLKEAWKQMAVGLQKPDAMKDVAKNTKDTVKELGKVVAAVDNLQTLGTVTT